MSAVLGTAAVALGLAAAVLGMATLAVGLRRNNPGMLRAGQRYVWLVLAGAVLATAAMQYALLSHDFSLEYVANNGSRSTPLLYTITTMWSALEGSILLWALVLAGYIAVMARHFRDRATDPIVAWATLVALGVAAFFFGLMAGPANPFRVVAGAIPLDGPGPNPLLQNHPLVAFHPPMLYLGYVGLHHPVRVRPGRPHHRSPRRGLAGGDPPVDALRLGLPHRRHRARGVVVLRGARVGRLLGVGPGGERLLPALADGDGLRPLGDGPGAAGHAPGLEPLAAGGDVLADHPGHVPHPLGRARLGPRLHRVAHRPGHPGVLRPGGRRVDRADRVAGRQAALARLDRRARSPGKRPSWPTTWPSPPSPSSCCSARSSRCWSRPSTATSCRSAPRTSTG